MVGDPVRKMRNKSIWNEEGMPNMTGRKTDGWDIIGSSSSAAWNEEGMPNMTGRKTDNWDIIGSSSSAAWKPLDQCYPFLPNTRLQTIVAGVISVTDPSQKLKQMK